MSSESNSLGRNLRITLAAALIVVMVAAIAIGLRFTNRSKSAGPTFTADDKLLALDAALDWTAARLIAVQDGQRYKTLDSFARETMNAMTGRESLGGLSPMASMFEWLLNRDAYVDQPLVRVRDMGVRIHFSAHMPEDRARQIRENGFMTLREFTSPIVEERKDELRERSRMAPAMRRVGEAEATAAFLPRLIRIVPRGGEAAWVTPDELMPNLPADVREAARGGPLEAQMDPRLRIAGIGEEAAMAVFYPWIELRQGWVSRDVNRVRTNLALLAERMPVLAATAGAKYPDLDQRRAETKYYAMGKFTWGWGAYFVGALASVWALVTRWRWSFILAQAWLLVGLIVHAYGIWLRWDIVGYVPVSNMFEAVTASAWIGISIMLGLELADRLRNMSRGWKTALLATYGIAAVWCAAYATYQIWFAGRGPTFTIDAIVLVGFTALMIGLYSYLLISSLRALPTMFYKPAVRPVFLLAANVTGFFALLVAAYVIPGGGTLSSIRAILDDVMLRVHTTLIIASYALIFLGAIIAVAYLFGYYHRVALQSSMELGIITAMAGGMLILLSFQAFDLVGAGGGTIHGYVKRPYVGVAGWVLTSVCALIVLILALLRSSKAWIAAVAVLLITCLTVAIGDHRFVYGMGLIMAIGGIEWFAANGVGALLFGAGARSAASESRPALATAGAPLSMLEMQRPVLAGGAPGDEHQRDLPRWLHDFDWCHLIILNLVFILLFIGTVLGAVWADYSWGRPWGWDPKEVFALNTWIVYAILIHTRFVVANKGLWTAWLSVIGCLMMAFNWVFVNFFIVGLHSYA